MDAATIQIVIEAHAHLIGIEEAKITVEQMTDAVKAYNKGIAEGLPLEAALIKMQQEGISTNVALIALTKEMTDAIKDQAAAQRNLGLQTGWNATFGAPLTAAEQAYAKLQMATQGASGANQNLVSGLWAAMPAWLQITAVIGALLIVFAPVTALILSAAVGLISFAAGAAGFLAVAGAVAIGFGAIAAAVLLLGGGGVAGGAGAAAALTTATDRLTNAKEALVEFDQEHTKQLTILQQHQREQLEENIANAQLKYNDALTKSQGPMAVLIGQLGAMKDAWSAQAAPLAGLMTLWLEKGIPIVQEFGKNIIGWFGVRMPEVLDNFGYHLRQLLPDLGNLGTQLGGAFDHVQQSIGGPLQDFARYGIQQVQGLLTNLVRLYDWFLKELPGLSPIVQSVFGFLGTQLQNLFTNWSKLTDWVVANWPATVKEAKDQLDKLGKAWKDLNDPQGSFQGALQGFIDLGTSLKGISDQVTPLIVDLGKIDRALKPLSDTLQAINKAIDDNGWWWHWYLTGANMPGPGGVPGHTGTGRTGTQSTTPYTLPMQGSSGSQGSPGYSAAVSPGGIHVHINNPIGGDGPYWDKVANQIAQRLSYTTGR